MRWDLRETFPVGKSKSFRALARDTGCRQELVQGSFQIKAFGGQDILKPTWASSILEFLLLVFKSLSCGEKHLLSAKTQRALEEKILCVNWEKTCRSLFSDPLRKKYSLFPFFLISCPELTGFSSKFPACSRLSAELLLVPPPPTEAGIKGGFQGEVLFLLFHPRLLPVAIAGARLQGGMSPEPMRLSQPGTQKG